MAKKKQDNPSPSSAKKPPARRGKKRGPYKPPVYTGPEWIGKSHTAKLAGQ
jgi:hypothetical protein